jgi:GPH family glycoside/pentoside/hexuronide:cation symporter
MGKARPWLLWSILPMAISVVLLFNVPSSLQMNGKIAYVFIVYTLLGAVFYTANNTAYNTMTSLVAVEQKDRIQMSSMRFVFATATMLAIGTFTLGIVDNFGGGKRGYSYVSMIYAAICVVTMLVTFLGTKEKTEYFAGQKQAAVTKVSPKKSFALLAKNKYFLLSGALFFVFYLIVGLSNVSVYYSQYVLGDAKLLGALTLSMFLPLLVGMLFISPILSKFGKRKVCLIGVGISVVGYAISIIYTANLPIFLIGMYIKSLGTVPVMASLLPFVADAVEYGDWKTGVRIEGTTYSVACFAIKVGSGLSGAMLGWLLAAGNYIPNAVAQPESALFVMNSLYLYLPAILSVLLFIIVLALDVEKIYPKIQQDLQERKGIAPVS